MDELGHVGEGVHVLVNCVPCNMDDMRQSELGAGSA